MTRRRGNNEGGLHHKPNGSWKASVSLQGHRLSKTFKTRLEAHDWLKQNLNQIDNGMTYESSRRCLSEHLKMWQDNEKHVMRQSTWLHYEQLIRDYINPNLGNMLIKDLQTEHIQRFYTRLVDQGVGIPTVQKIHKLLRSSLRILVQAGTLIRNPVSYAHPPKSPNKEMHVLDDTQVSQFLVSITGHRWEALFYLAITTGMRRSELLGLKWDDLDWIKKTLKVERQSSKQSRSNVQFLPLKTRYSRRTVALGEKTIAVLRDHSKNQQLQRLNVGKSWVENGLMFTNTKGGPLCANHMTRVFQELLKEAGLPRIRFHDLRHTAASLMLNNGIPIIVVSRRLGHSKASTTLDVYGHLIDSMQGEAANLMDDLITPVKLFPTVPAPVDRNK